MTASIISQATVDQVSIIGSDSAAVSEVGNFSRGNITTNHVDLRGSLPTYFLCLTLPLWTAHHPIFDQFEEVTAGADALEFRVDLLSPDGKPPSRPAVPSLNFVAAQLAALRQLSTLPIVYTVRTVAQGGMCPDDAENEIFALMQFGVESGCEYVDLETHWSSERMRAFVERKQSTEIICSWHDWSGALKWDSQEMIERYRKAKEYGDIVKLVTKATTLTDNLTMIKFRENFADGPPLITLNIGLVGQLSRILNPVFSPITHPALSATAPGQLSFSQVQQGLHLIGQLPARKFWLFGTPIGHSKSPLIHNTAFELLGLPHHYGLHESSEVDNSVRELIRAPDFGGASVTVPHKLEIMPLLDDISASAKLIGAVNTIIPIKTAGGAIRLLGENTDWLALFHLINQNVSAEKERTSTSPALVIGAGGSSRAAIYALHQAGFTTIYLFNRTFGNAQKIVDSFPSKYNIVALTSLENAFGPSSREEPIVIISTIAATSLSTEYHSNPEAGVFVGKSALARKKGGLVIDAAYKPKLTPLINLAQQIAGWKTVPGIYMLLEQGFRQNILFTGRKSPKNIISAKVLAEYEIDMKQA